MLEIQEYSETGWKTLETVDSRPEAVDKAIEYKRTGRRVRVHRVGDIGPVAPLKSELDSLARSHGGTLTADQALTWARRNPGSALAGACIQDVAGMAKLISVVNSYYGPAWCRPKGTL